MISSAINSDQMEGKHDVILLTWADLAKKQNQQYNLQNLLCLSQLMRWQMFENSSFQHFSSY